MDPKIVNFVIPIGAINLNGSAMFNGLALVFLAQLSDISLGMADIIMIT